MYLFDLILGRSTVYFGGPNGTKVGCNISILLLAVRLLSLNYSKLLRNILCCLICRLEVCVLIYE